MQHDYQSQKPETGQEFNSRLEPSAEVTIPPGSVQFKEAKDQVELSSPRDGLAKWKWPLSVTGILFSSFLYGLDSTISADLQVPIYEDFHKLDDMAWVGLGFPMASVSIILLMGKLYSMFDIKILMLMAILLFEVGSAICGAAPSSAALIVGRVIAGMGGCGMYQGALAYISTFTRGREVPMYNSLIGIFWGLGAILGPVVGGGFSVSSATWRWAFYINLPLCALFAPIYIFAFPSHKPRPLVTTGEMAREIDWAGAVLIIPVFVLLMIVVSFGGSKYAWSSGTSIALWVVWGLCLFAFSLQQYFTLFTTTENRLFPLYYLKSRTMVLLFICTATSSTVNAVPLFYVPVFFQFTKSDSALMAAVRLLPFIGVFIATMFLAGGLLPVVGRYNLFYIVGGVFNIVGGVLMFTAPVDVSAANIYGYEILLAVGTGLSLQNAYSVALAKASNPRRKQDALGFLLVAQLGVIALTLAMCGSLFQNLGFQFLKDSLASYNLSDDMVRSALAGTISPIFTGETDAGLVQIVIDTVAFTISRLYGVVIAAGAAMLLSGLLMNWEKLSLEIAAAG